MAMIRTALEILLSKGVRKENGCLEWPFARNKQGYGRFLFRKKIRSVHRVAKFLVEPFDLDNTKIKILHRCNNPPCFDPEHLIKGTQSRNIMMAHVHGRRECWKTTPRDSKGRFSKDGD